MATQLRFDEDFIEDCRMSAVPDHLLELGCCIGCKHLAKLSGGYCGDCADPILDKEDDTEKTKSLDEGPAVVSGRGIQSTTGLEPADGPTIASAAAAVKA